MMSSATSCRQLLAPPTVAHRDRDGALGVGLAHDMHVELLDDLARRQVLDGDGIVFLLRHSWT